MIKPALSCAFSCEEEISSTMGCIGVLGDWMVETVDALCKVRSLELRNDVLRFPSHDKRKTRTPQTDQRWAMRETAWEVVGG